MEDKNLKHAYCLNGFEIISNPPRRRTNTKNRESSSSEDSSIDTDPKKEHLEENSLTEEIRCLSDLKYVYNYLEHPADVILMGQGNNVAEAFQSISVGLFNYISDLELVRVKHKREINVSGSDLRILLFHFLDECLYLCSGRQYFIAKHVKILNEISLPSSSNLRNYTPNVSAIAYGDFYDPSVHRSGTEVKAITMHDLSIKLWIGGTCIEYSDDMDFVEKIYGLTDCQSSEFVIPKVEKCEVYTLIDI